MAWPSRSVSLPRSGSPIDATYRAAAIPTTSVTSAYVPRSAALSAHAPITCSPIGSRSKVVGATSSRSGRVVSAYPAASCSVLSLGYGRRTSADSRARMPSTWSRRPYRLRKPLAGSATGSTKSCSADPPSFPGQCASMHNFAPSAMRRSPPSSRRSSTKRCGTSHCAAFCYGSIGARSCRAASCSRSTCSATASAGYGSSRCASTRPAKSSACASTFG